MKLTFWRILQSPNWILWYCICIKSNFTNHISLFLTL